MHKLERTILGVNHMFLYPESMVNGDVHTATLADLAQTPYMDALDCWVWASHAREELAILRNSGKVINYNIGDRFGEVPVFPASADKTERDYARKASLPWNVALRKSYLAAAREFLVTIRGLWIDLWTSCWNGA